MEVRREATGGAKAAGSRRAGRERRSMRDGDGVGAVAFPGFSREGLRFLRENRERNSRAWFDEHRPTYEELLLEPFRLLVVGLSPVMRRIDPRFETTPAVDRTISRLRRDTRFSPDKSLYRDRMWLAFRRPRKDWTGHPSYYFEIRPEGYRYGLGYYEAERSTMERFRARIDAEPAVFRRAIAPLRRDGRFELAGETYKRPPPGPHSPEIQDWYRRKSFYLACNRGIDALLLSPALEEDLRSGFRVLAPLYRFLIALEEG